MKPRSSSYGEALFGLARAVKLRGIKPGEANASSLGPIADKNGVTIDYTAPCALTLAADRKAI